MIKAELAAHLRKRLIDRQLVDASKLRGVSDDDVIDSFVTCSYYGKRQVADADELARIIDRADSVEAFFDLCAWHAH
jgi:hypothetical protein